MARMARISVRSRSLKRSVAEWIPLDYGREDAPQELLVLLRLVGRQRVIPSPQTLALHGEPMAGVRCRSGFAGRGSGLLLLGGGGPAAEELERFV